VVFNTSMTGYQEVLTDPSYAGQIVTMTAPQIGNYGVAATDAESAKPQVAGFVMRDPSPVSSNWRAQGTLRDYLTRHNIVAIGDIDTRAHRSSLGRRTRPDRDGPEGGAQNGPGDQGAIGQGGHLTSFVWTRSDEWRAAQESASPRARATQRLAGGRSRQAQHPPTAVGYGCDVTCFRRDAGLGSFGEPDGA
jgi:hypothetical protein